MFVRGLLALEERRRGRADRVVRPYEWQRFALRDVVPRIPCRCEEHPKGTCFMARSDAAIPPSL